MDATLSTDRADRGAHPFDHELRDSTDAREMFIAMARHAVTSA
jgi:hypothetical protein